MKSAAPLTLLALDDDNSSRVLCPRLSLDSQTLLSRFTKEGATDFLDPLL